MDGFLTSGAGLAPCHPLFKLIDGATPPSNKPAVPIRARTAAVSYDSKLWTNEANDWHSGDHLFVRL